MRRRRRAVEAGQLGAEDAMFSSFFARSMCVVLGFSGAAIDYQLCQPLSLVLSGAVCTLWFSKKADAWSIILRTI